MNNIRTGRRGHCGVREGCVQSICEWSDLKMVSKIKIKTKDKFAPVVGAGAADLVVVAHAGRLQFVQEGVVYGVVGRGIAHLVRVWVWVWVGV